MVVSHKTVTGSGASRKPRRSGSGRRVDDLGIKHLLASIEHGRTVLLICKDVELQINRAMSLTCPSVGEISLLIYPEPNADPVLISDMTRKEVGAI